MDSTKRTRIRRRAKRLPQSRQPGLFPEPLPEVAPPPTAPGPARFLLPSPEEIFIGDQPLRRYLHENNLGWVVRLRDELLAADWSALTAAYDRHGRQAIHPAAMLGLVLYGVIERQSSLRALEKLARRDVGAWWLTGGLHPDHSTIGAFVQRHAAVLSEEFFVTLTGQLCRKLKLTPATAAGDGTVIEAATSHYRLLSAEAARDAAAQAPDDAQAQTAAVIATARETQRRARGEDGGKARVSPVEPEAPVQQQKNGTHRPSYKPSVLTHESGLIVGQQVDPTAEAAVIPALLAQHAAVLGGPPRRTLLDAGYHTHEVLGLFASLELDVLCPAGKATAGRWTKRGPSGRFGKDSFAYDPVADVFVCPAGHRLTPRQQARDRHDRSYRVYRGVSCAACAQRAACTTSQTGRVLRRYDGDEVKDAMREVLAQPAARRAYAQRQAIVEPVFAELRERQGLRRFHRYGLAGARLEFALHCIALNLRRALRLTGAFAARFQAFFALLAGPGGPWTLTALVVTFPAENITVAYLRIQKIAA